MDRDEGVFKDGSPDVTAGNVVANLLGGCKFPELLAIQGGNRDTARNVDALGDVGNGSQGALDTIVNSV